MIMESNDRKEKLHKRHKGISLKTIIIIVIAVLVFMAIIVCIACGILSYYIEEKSYAIHMSDWLMAGCTLLSMFGTIFLACVSIAQSNKANELNEKLIKQNESLQRINDTQFKITNQDKFPILEVTPYKLSNAHYSRVNEDIWKLNDKSSCVINMNDKVELTAFFLDLRDKKTSRKYNLLRFDIINRSQYAVKDIKIYRVICSKTKGNITNQYGFNRDVEWLYFNKILLKDSGIRSEIVVALDEDTYEENNSKISFILFFEMHTITGLIFYEKVSCFSDNQVSYSHIEALGLTKDIF